MATDRIAWAALRAVPVVDLAQARYGAPKREKGWRGATTWVFDAPDHGGVVIVHRREGYFRATDGTKGSGALDWLVRIEGLSLADARQRLEYLAPGMERAPEPPPPPRVYQPLRHVPAACPAVRRYLIQERGLPADLVDALRQQDRLRAVWQGGVPYAAFSLVDAHGREVGASLRCAGTLAQQATQHAPKRAAAGSDVRTGWWTPHDPRTADVLAVVEAPLDAIALLAWAQDHRWPLERLAIRALNGNTLNPRHWTDRPWAKIAAAQDADAAGDQQAAVVAAWGQAHGVPVVRVVPPAKDWCEAWAGRQRAVGQEAEAER